MNEATANGRPLLLCLSHLRWKFVFQRPHHILTRAIHSYDVVYWEEPEYRPGCMEADIEPTVTVEGILVIQPVLPAELDENESDTALQILLRSFLADKHVSVAWFYTPIAYAFAHSISSDIIVYDCMDELTLFLGAAPRLVLLEKRLLRAADVVFTGGRSLHRAKQSAHKNVHCFRSSVDVKHFEQARTHALPEPLDQRDIPHPRIGLFGVIDERLDQSLLASLAATRPDWHFIIVGPVTKIHPQDLPQAKNIHWLGSKTYQELPAYLASWDAGFMPFAINDATRFISPTKTPEFLAAGLPTVCTPIDDVVADWGEAGLVRIAATLTEFVENLEEALFLPRGPWVAQVQTALSGLSWDKVWHGMSNVIHIAQQAHKQPGQNALPKTRTHVFDWVVVGAGFAGAVLAERLARDCNQTVLVLDKRTHVGGNAYDHKNSHGILVHKYGPHIFHTNSPAIVEYLSRFTAWRPYEHRVLGNVDGRLVPIPINLDTINTLYGLSLSSEELETWFAARAEPVDDIRTSEDVVVSKIGRELYEKFFKSYTRKQWGLDPSELDRAVTSRVPVRTNRDDRYFTDTFQAMPRDGYTAMFDRMLDHPNITVRLATEYNDCRATISFNRLIWTGPVDEFFGHIYGALPYRSLRFHHETLPCKQFQSAAVVNFPQTEEYTRITEYKYLTGQKHEKTSLTYEYPTDVGDPYYPVPRPENAELYRRYQLLADATPNTWFVGRLATYRYMNMDQVVGQALSVFRTIVAQTSVGVSSPEAAPPEALRKAT